MRGGRLMAMAMAMAMAMSMHAVLETVVAAIRYAELLSPPL